MSLDDERTNRVFSIFCCGVLIALVMGLVTGSLVTYFLLKR